MEALALWRALQIALPNSSYFARCLLANSAACSLCFSKDRTSSIAECNFSIRNTRISSMRVIALRSHSRIFATICSAVSETWRLAMVMLVSKSASVVSNWRIRSRQAWIFFFHLSSAMMLAFSSSAAFSIGTTSWLLWSVTMQRWQTQIWHWRQ